MAKASAVQGYERLNISLPRETVGLLERVTTRGNRSRFIDEAIRTLARARSRAALARALEEGYARRSSRDLALVEEWFPVDEEAGRRGKVRRARKRG